MAMVLYTIAPLAVVTLIMNYRSVNAIHDKMHALVLQMFLNGLRMWVYMRARNFEVSQCRNSMGPAIIALRVHIDEDFLDHLVVAL